jgi:hypothetical protein
LKRAYENSSCGTLTVNTLFEDKKNVKSCGSTTIKTELLKYKMIVYIVKFREFSKMNVLEIVTASCLNGFL